MNIDQLRKICKKFPHATEDIKWGYDLCFCVGEKMFCVTDLEGPMQVSLKVTDEEFEEFSVSKNSIPAPYVARYKWALIQNPNRFTKNEWKHYIKQSYTLVKSKLSVKIKKQLGI